MVASDLYKKKLDAQPSSGVATPAGGHDRGVESAEGGQRHWERHQPGKLAEHDGGPLLGNFFSEVIFFNKYSVLQRKHPKICFFKN